MFMDINEVMNQANEKGILEIHLTVGYSNVWEQEYQLLNMNYTCDITSDYVENEENGERKEGFLQERYGDRGIKQINAQILKYVSDMIKMELKKEIEEDEEEHSISI